MTSQGTPEYTTPPQNMVQVVENTVQAYDMGAIRALAQEPVQNSKDAKNSPTVTIEYQLHNRGEAGFMLTVTDRGTTGLGGPVLTQGDIQRRNGVLEQGYDWAAFEGQGYTKTNEDALGSRGQGKAAFLYNSDVQGTSGQRRMAMIYDTLLPNGEYRLGVRYARPSDSVRTPPLKGHDARDAIRSNAFRIDADFTYPLALDPLGHVGTRVVVPYLSREAVEAIHARQLDKWLQLLWWRSIQTRNVSIALVDERGEKRQVTVPDWWAAEPWRDSPLPSSVNVESNVPVPGFDELRIKRLVLLHDPELEAHEHLYDPSKPEFDGVQVMRGMQWIETRSSRVDFDQYVPKDVRPGFRGFVEFEQRLDRELRSSEYEKPQHDGYDGRKPLIRAIRRSIESRVEKFAREQDWLESTKAKQSARDSERTAMQRVLRVFVQPQRDTTGVNGSSGTGKTIWHATIQMDYPQPGTTRVNWGEDLKRLYVSCNSNPPFTYGTVSLALHLLDTEGNSTLVLNRKGQLKTDGTVGIELGDLVVFRHGSRQQHISCPTEGKYWLKAEIEFEGRVVARPRRVIYVQQNPPEPPSKSPVTVSIEAVNATSPERRRINSGEHLRVSVRLTNRTNKDIEVWPYVTFVASELPGFLLAGVDAPDSWQLVDADETGSIILKGTPLGERPEPHQLPQSTMQLLTQPRLEFDSASVVLAAGRHSLNVDVRDTSGAIEISRSQFVYFESDPPGAGAELPFRLIQHADESQARTEASPNWWMTQENGPDGAHSVNYSAVSPMYRAAEIADSAGKDSDGTSAFIAEIACDALIDWAGKHAVDHDTSRLDMITRGADFDDLPNQPRWERLREQIHTYVDKCNDGSSQADELSLRRRQIIANMVRLTEEDTQD